MTFEESPFSSLTYFRLYVWIVGRREYEVDFTLDGRRLSYVDASVGNVELARRYCEKEGRSMVQVDSDRLRQGISDQLHKIEVSMSKKVLEGRKSNFDQKHFAPL